MEYEADGDVPQQQPPEDAMDIDAAEEEQRRQKRAEKEKRRKELMDEIQRKYRSSAIPLEINIKNDLREKLEDLDIEELENVLHNMDVDLIQGAPLTAVEKGMFAMYSYAANEMMGVDIYQDMLDDPSLKVDLREAIGSSFMQGYPSVRFVMKTMGMLVAKLVPSLSDKVKTIVDRNITLPTPPTHEAGTAPGDGGVRGGEAPEESEAELAARFDIAGAPV
jgi:hypothetical protein